LSPNGVQISSVTHADSLTVLPLPITGIFIITYGKCSLGGYLVGSEELFLTSLPMCNGHEKTLGPLFFWQAFWECRNPGENKPRINKEHQPQRCGYNDETTPNKLVIVPATLGSLPTQHVISRVGRAIDKKG